MRRSLPVAVLAFSMILALGACGKTKDTGFNNLPPAKTGGGSAAPAGVKLVAGNAFDPVTFKAKAGDKVTWTSSDKGAPHNVVSDTGLFDSNPNCLKDTSACMADGQSFSFTFAKAGKYLYYCVIHGGKGGVGMAGVVEVG